MPSVTEDLLAAGQRRLIGAELGDVTAFLAGPEFHQLYTAPWLGAVVGGCQFGAHAKRIDGRAGGDELENLVLVEVAGAMILA